MNLEQQKPAIRQICLAVFLFVLQAVLDAWGILALLEQGQFWAIAPMSSLLTLGMAATAVWVWWLLARPTDAIVTALRAIAQGQFDQSVSPCLGLGAIARSIDEINQQLPQYIDQYLADRLADDLAQGTEGASSAPLGDCEQAMTARAVLRAIPDLMFRVNRQGVYAGFVPTGEQLDLWGGDEKPAGQYLGNVVPDYIAALQLHATQWVLEHQQLYIYEQAISLGDSIRYEEVRVVPYGSDEALFMVRDITQQRLIEQETRTQKAFLQQILDGMPSLISVKDKTGRWIQVNRAAAEKFGTVPDALIGRRELDLILDFDKRQYAEWLRNNRQVMRSRQPMTIADEQIMGIDGKTRWYQTVLSPLIDIDSNVLGVICHSIDISDRKQIELELQESKERAEAANLAKSAFLSNISHELRTPLNAILGFAQVMRYDDLVSQEHREYIDIMIQSSEHLLSLINNILDVVKTEAGEVPRTDQAINLPYFMRSLQSVFQLRAQEKNLSFVVVLLPDVPTYVYLDSQKLRQILTNLIDNALKFTQQGCITLTVRSHITEASGTISPVVDSAPIVLDIEIADTGIGIDADKQQYVFEMFTQIPQEGALPDGMGVGLALSDRLAKLMGGTLSVESQLGQGSTFYLQLPAQSIPPVDGLTYPPPQSLRPIRGLTRVLVADSVLQRQQQILNWLLEDGFQVRGVGDRAECLSCIETWQPDSIILGDIPELTYQDLRLFLKGAAIADPYLTRMFLLQDCYLCGNSSEFSAFDLQSSLIPTGDYPEGLAGDLPLDMNLEMSLDMNLGIDVEAIAYNALLPDTLRDRLSQKMIEHTMPYSLYVNSEGDLPNTAPKLADLPSLTDPNFATMPQEWYNDLYRAALRCDDQAVKLLIRHVPEQQSKLMSLLVQLTSQFQFDVIAALAKTYLACTLADQSNA